jgi:dihydroxy-acid dehydratase
VSDYVKQGITQAGGTPVEFGVIAACDGIANGHAGMHFILPSRELIANDVETMVEAHRLDAVALLGSCDKIVPGMLMAAARLDIPAILVPGGPMEGGCEFDGRAADTTSLTEGLAMLQTGRIDRATYDRLEDCASPTCGSCSFLGTANTMCCLAEALGMSLPGSATIPATKADRLRAAQESGRRIVDMVCQGIVASDIINKKALENAVRLNAAIGGSTNAILHLLALAYEADVELTVNDFEELCRTTPHIARMNPAAAPNVPDFDAAGGVRAVMNEILPLLHGDALTVTGQTVADNVRGAVVRDRRIIRSCEEPWAQGGGLAVLWGNLAPNSAITKPAAIDPEMHTFRGKAHCFDVEEAANQAILDGQVREGEVVVIRYEGPKGGPGMREMYTAMKLLYGCGLARKTALVTDGRFSGTNSGCFVGHISPEAAEGGPLAIVQDGDMITVDIPNRRLDLHVSDQEIKARLATWQRPAPRFEKGYLALYARLAESADKGAIIRHQWAG